MKTQGFNMKNTHIKDLERLAKLLAVLTIGFVFTVKFGVIKNLVKPIKIKNHNRRLFSIFSYGLTFLRKILMQSKFIEIFDFFLRSIMSNNPLNSKLEQLCIRY
ncbi:hypothetical protein [Candidatus Sarmatiella mevalonica]|uniref:hypothetical protein n=1 Tax=Candidatus Sarmatiella mevalonica TaxID=2770581 RepID=UPI0019223B24|nr:hypothetical protein [Candidatus Sarmatiella mevalonica]